MHFVNANSLVKQTACVLILGSPKKVLRYANAWVSSVYVAVPDRGEEMSQCTIVPLKAIVHQSSICANMSQGKINIRRFTQVSSVVVSPLIARPYLNKEVSLVPFAASHTVSA